MFSHFTLGTNDLARSQGFYDPVMEALGQRLVQVSLESGYLMYAPDDGRHPHLFLCRPVDALPATWSNGFHIAYTAPDKSAVERFYEAALAQGGLDEGAPGLRPQYAEDYYAAYVRDPDGNKLQAVCYLKGRAAGPGGDVLSHITLGHADLERERKFYGAVLGELGLVEVPEEGAETSVAYGVGQAELPVVYVQTTFDGRPATWGNGTHAAFTAPSREAVRRFHTVALAQGGSCDGAPGLRPQYSENYYAAYVRDAVGNKLQAVCRQPS